MRTPALFAALTVAGFGAWRSSQAQTNPILQIQPSGPAFELSWTNRPGGDLLEFSEALSGSNSGAWRPFAWTPLLQSNRLSLRLAPTNQTQFFRLRSTDPTAQAPAPEASAPALDRTVATSLKTAAEFLYTGPNPIQIGVAPGTIDARRVAVLRGKTKQRNGSALPGVLVRVKDHPEYGYTLTRADGMFDLVINGGGQLVINYERNGYLSVQRYVTAPWNDYTWLPDVVLIPLDPVVTTVQFGPNTSAQVATSSVQTDADGTRSAKILIPAGTAAELVLPDGSRVPASTLRVRATEYSVGTNGAAAMPAPLPPSSGYTYCVELSADEAVQAGAVKVGFNQPLSVYVENFLQFPVGMAVPTGYYDRSQSAWIPWADGRVIEVLSVGAGVAQIDTDGDGQADSGSLVGITDSERTQLGASYAAGQKLWRVRVLHFTPFDCNSPFGPPTNAVPPPRPPPSPLQPDDPCAKSGSIVEAETQVLGESLPIQGTRLSLIYRSENVPGNKTPARVEIPVSADVPPGSLMGAQVLVNVAGQRVVTEFNPVPTNLTYHFIWDGRDAYGRAVEGYQTALVEVRHIYPLFYRDVRVSIAAGILNLGPSSWSAFGDPQLTVGKARTALGAESFQAARTWQRMVTVPDARHQRLGGWTLNVHHRFHPDSGVLEFGDRPRSIKSKVVYQLVAGGPFSGSPQEGASAVAASFSAISDIARGRDGSLYIAHIGDVWKVGTDGILRRFAGGGTNRNEGIPATNALISTFSPRIALGPDDSLYFGESTTNGFARVRRVRPDGIIHTVAGGGDPPIGNGDGGLATGARLQSANDVAVGADGSLYVLDGGFFSSVVRRVDPAGIISTFAGVEVQGADNGDGGPAADATFLSATGIAVGPDGSVYLDAQGAIRRIDTSGIVNTVAGNGNVNPPPDYGVGLPSTQFGLGNAWGVDIGADGSIYFGVPFNLFNSWLGIYKVGLDGIRNRVAGDGTLGGVRTGDPASKPMPGFYALALGPDGQVYFATDRQVFGLVQPRLVVPATSDIFIPSEDGLEVFQFDPFGRHLKTLDAITGLTKYQFSYTAAGLLASVTDGEGRVTQIERDGSGNATAIVAPTGERTTLTLDANNFLATLTQPGGRTHMFAYSGAGGLLSTYTNPLGLASHYAYDSDGRLIRNENPAGGFTELRRTDDSNGFSITTRTAGGETNVLALHTFNNGRSVRDNSSLCCDIQSVTTQPNGDQERHDADGSMVFNFVTSDQRFAAFVEVTTNLTFRTPGETPPARVIETTRNFALSNPQDPLSLSGLTETVRVNGASYVRGYVRAAGIITNRGPEGRVIRSQLDNLGRVTSVTLSPSLASSLIQYDALGRPTNVSFGAQAHAYSYDAQDRLRRVTDATGTSLEYEHDVAGRTSVLALPGVWTNRFAYDALGHPTNVIMANGAVHRFTYSPIGRLASYTPPGGGTFLRSHDLAGALISVTLPGGRSATRTYDEMRRIKTWNTPEANCGFTYADASANLATMSRTPVSLGAAQTLEFKGGGPLPTNIVWSGAANGTFLYQYNNDFNVTRRRLTSGTDVHEVLLAYDRDGLTTNVGPFRIVRANAGGAISQIADSALTLTIQHDLMARLTRRTYVVAGQQRFRFDLTYDAAGRVIQKVETNLATSHTEVYGYNAGRRLASVTRDGTPVETYGYDANGNRTSRTVGGLAETVSYDANDRPGSAAGETWNFNADGQLAARGSMTLVHGTRGELLQVGLPGGATITYSYDALGRRVARTSAAGSQQYFYGNRERPLEITHSRDAGGTLTAYYYDDLGILFSLERGGNRYYVAADPSGSPRLVFDASGNVVKQFSYGDSFGADPTDSNPGFEFPIGYAGGLADPATRLVRFGWRDYDQRAGVWITRDPVLFRSGSPNLYAYVGGNPVSLRDPAGAVAIGFSAYAGIGAGFKVSLTSKGISVCGEAGFGVGGGVEVNPFGGLEKSGDKIKLEGSLGYGPASLGGEIKLDDCGNLTAKLKLGVGPFQVDTDDGPLVSGKLEDRGENVLDQLKKGPTEGAPFGLDAELKLAAESCRGISF